MLIPVLLLAGAAGSYAFFPSTWGKARRKLLHRHQTKGHTLYLTFDDGPSPDYTPALLDLLAEHHVPATFFVVTEFARKNPSIIYRMKEEGHVIGFHSAHHTSAYLMPPRQTQEDFSQGLDDLTKLGVPPRLFRPPWGVVNLSSLYQVKKHRLTPTLWDVMAQDWRGDITTAEIIRRLRVRTRPGSVICLHDGRGAPGAPGRTIEALSILLPEWLAQGFCFRTLENYG